MKRDLSGDQIRAARALLGWSMPFLAERAGVHRNSVWRLENGVGARYSHAAERIIRTIEDAGVEFTITGAQLRAGR
jgi:transcriptional regulator with XRE-family HTH domain